MSKTNDTLFSKKGLRFKRHFTKDGVSPYDLFDYELRSSVIKNPNGDKVFEMNDVEVPKGWCTSGHRYLGSEILP